MGPLVRKCDKAVALKLFPPEKQHQDRKKPKVAVVMEKCCRARSEPVAVVHTARGPQATPKPLKFLNGSVLDSGTWNLGLHATGVTVFFILFPEEEKQFVEI